MTRDEIREAMVELQKSFPEYRIMQAVLLQQAELDEIYNKINEIILAINNLTQMIKPAEALNDDIPEDKEEEAPVE